jgi:adenine-specific DNA-methyltransferase
MIDVPQPAFNISDDHPLDSVEEYTFEPIKGYPMLNWKGKRPFTSTHYYPAQLKEVYGPEVAGWRNKIYWGDNLQVMSHLLKEYRNKIMLVYIDPPYDSKADYKKKIQLKGQRITNDQNSFEEKQYTDIWTNDEYLQFTYERLILIRELLSDKGSIYLHCDYHKNYLLRCILDEVFGSQNFINEIIWYYPNKFKFEFSTNFGTDTETILLYAKSKGNHLLHHIKVPTKNKRKQNRVTWDPIQKKMVTVKDGNGNVVYYESDEKIVGTLWEIARLNSMANDITGYPTQKPKELLERIILAASNPGDLVLDCFMGSGTTQAVAMKLGRRFIGADINMGAVQITTKRLINVVQEIMVDHPSLLPTTDEEPVIYYPGIEIYNVNHYDMFRNPSEARDLLIDALEINVLPSTHLFDGEKDGRLWKIMPIDRIATRADLNPLISGFDYKSFERHKAERPNQPVEKINLVCMGHEPDLMAALQKEVHPYELDIEVVDILRDRQDLQFKRDSEVKVIVQDGLLIIERFYPMNLLSKLSVEKEKVVNWRELVESIMIDWNYDGAVLQPGIVDIPEKNELVSGKYKIPEDARTIRLKITDLLSESLEMDVVYG